VTFFACFNCSHLQGVLINTIEMYLK
jgi:hypothetical protein